MKINRSVPFNLQQDQQDCGVACLRNILNYYQAEVSLEKLREWSGTGIQGSSMLGLYQAASQAGFRAQGARAGGTADLRELHHPCILHVTLGNGQMHYVVFYPSPLPKKKNIAFLIGRPNLLLIGDPAKGLVYLTGDELEKIWTSQTLLLLEPGDKLNQWQQQRKKKLHWLWETLKEEVHLLYVALALGAVCALLNLSTAVFSQQLIDRILPGRHLPALYLGLGSLGLLLILRCIFSFLRQDLLIRQGYGFNIRITGRFFRSILYLNKSFFDHRKTGDLTARLGDTLRIQQAVSYILGDMAIQALLLLVTLGLLFVYCWPIALACLALVPIVFGLVKYFEKDIIRGQREVMMTHARNESNYVDTIRGISTIKAMNRQPLFIAAGAGFFQSFQDAILRLGRTRIRFSVLLEVVTAIFLLSVIGWASLKVLNGSIRIGGLIAIIQLSGLLVQTIVTVALTNLQVQEAGVALDRLYEFTMLEPEFTPPDNPGPGQPTPSHPDPSEPAPEPFRQMSTPMPLRQLSTPEPFRQLSIQKIGFRFPGRKLLLKDISMEIRRGEIIALAGESGQGKSTLLQVLQKFYPYEGGSIRFNDLELSDIDTWDWRSRIGVVHQDPAVFSGTLLANICLDPKADPLRLAAFCEEYGFDRYFENLPQSYATLLGEGGISLSGGQRQLLALARCLFSTPQLVLLDEPTSAMDSATERFVISILRRYRSHAGLLIISHKDSLTEIADRIYFLDDGASFQLPRTAPHTEAN